MPLIKAQESLLQMPRTAKRLLALAVDACVCVLTVWLALCLRLEQWVYIEGAYWWPVLGAVLMALPLFARLGLYRALFRYASWHATHAGEHQQRSTYAVGHGDGVVTAGNGGE